jgi:SP family general alpha glucoside:H+ symporter-like MFS transporter
MSANLSCTFDVPQKRGGNQGVRATVLNELRDSQGSHAPIATSPVEPAATPFQHPSPHNGGLESITIDACINAYLQRIYPVVPFLDEAILRAQADHTSDSILSRQFIVSFCAYVVTFGTVLDESLLVSSHTSAQQLGTELLNAALRIHNADRISSSSPLSVFISFFLYGAYAGLGNYRQAWFYLREVTTLLMMQKIEGTTSWPSPSMYRRMFWVSLISER